MISIVIPALNEEKALPATLAAIRAANDHLRANARLDAVRAVDPIEIIVADGASDDSTRAIARAEPGVSVLTATRGRASQMNAGACRARGEWLLFLHADTLLAPTALSDIAMLDDSIDVGCFTHRFSGNNRRLRMISWIHGFRWRKTGIIYGDQGLFIRRALFERLGGFPQVETLEDVQFSERVLAHARPIMLDAEIVTDSRKFEQKGPLTSFARCVAIVLCFRVGLPLPSRKFFEPIR